MDHRLNTSSTPGPNPLRLYYPFISPAAYLPTLTAQQEVATTTTKDLFSPSAQPQKSNFSMSRILQNRPSSVNDDDLIRSPSLSIHQHKSLIDTAAKMLWLQQMATVQQHPLLSRPIASDPKKPTKKRKLGRNPRIPFTQQQIEMLEKRYSSNRYLSSLDVVDLSKNLELSEARVKIWFQNRRARERRDEKSAKASLSFADPGHCMLFSSGATTPPLASLGPNETAAEIDKPWSVSTSSGSTLTLLPSDDARHIDNSMGHSSSTICNIELANDNRD